MNGTLAPAGIAICQRLADLSTLPASHGPSRLRTRTL